MPRFWAVLAVLAALALVLPAVLCLCTGGALMAFGAVALAVWATLAWWVWEEIWRYLRQDFADEYV